MLLGYVLKRDQEEEKVAKKPKWILFFGPCLVLCQYSGQFFVGRRF